MNTLYYNNLTYSSVIYLIYYNIHAVILAQGGQQICSIWVSYFYFFKDG